MQITPRGPVQTMLYVESVTPSYLIVKSSDPGDGEVSFDYVIYGVRAGFENHQVVRPKREMASS